MRGNLKFDFFNRLAIEIDVGGHVGYENYFTNEYDRIRSISLPETQVNCSPEILINVHIVRKLPSARDSDLVRSVNVKNLFIYHYLVRDLDSKNVKIFFKTHPIDKVYMNAIGVFLQAQVLEPVLYLKLLEENLLLMHAAGICDDRQGFLFPAHGGTGKTTFSLSLLKHGYKLLGDDLLFVDVREQRVYPYPRPLHLFSYNASRLEVKVPTGIRAIIHAKNVARFFLERFLRTEFLISTRVHADQLFRDDPFGKPVPYAGLYFLVRSGPPTLSIPISESNIGDFCKEIMASADLNRSLYEMLGDDRQVALVKAKEERLIRKLLSQIGHFNYVNPRSMREGETSLFVEKYLRATMATVH